MIEWAVGGAVVGALLGWWARRYGGKAPTKARKCPHGTYDKNRLCWVTCNKIVRHCISGYCRVHCKEELCECLEERQLGDEEREILEEVRAVTKSDLI